MILAYLACDFLSWMLSFICIIFSWFFDLAHGYFLNGKGKVSAAILEEIIELQPDNSKAHFRRGVILWEL